MVVLLVFVLTLTGMALLKVAEGQLHQAVRFKSQETAFSAAEEIGRASWTVRV